MNTLLTIHQIIDPLKNLIYFGTLSYINFDHTHLFMVTVKFKCGMNILIQVNGIQTGAFYHRTTPTSKV